LPHQLELHPVLAKFPGSKVRLEWTEADHCF
jgi:hypothetical protein